MRYLLLALVLFLTLSAVFGFDPGPMPGVKIKNGLLYLIVLGLMLRVTLDRNYRIQLPGVPIIFGVMIGYALLTYAAIVMVIEYPRYDPVFGAFQLKNQLIDHMLFFLVFFYGLRTNEDAMTVLKVLLAAWAVSHIMAALDATGVFHLGDIEQRGDGRVQGAVGESNQYGAFVALTLPATIAMVTITRGMWRIFWMTASVITAAVLVMFRRCALVIYVSHKQREYWRARGLRVKRDIVIQNGIDADHFTDRSTAQQKAATRAEFGFAPSDFVIGICAGLRPEKAHGDLLQALRRLRDSGVPAKVLMIGDGPRRGAIERQIAELELTGHAVIAGHRNDVRPYIACCDVMTLTSHLVETFSIAALESMALGKPMVLTRIGGAEEQIRHGTNGFLYERGDVAALAHLLRRLTAATDRLSMQIEPTKMNTAAANTPCCPSCGQPMKLARVTPRFGGLPELQTYECRPCGATLTESVDES